MPSWDLWLIAPVRRTVGTGESDTRCGSVGPCGVHGVSPPAGQHGRQPGAGSALRLPFLVCLEDAAILRPRPGQPFRLTNTGITVPGHGALILAHVPKDSAVTPRSVATAVQVCVPTAARRRLPAARARSGGRRPSRRWGLHTGWRRGCSWPSCPPAISDLGRGGSVIARTSKAAPSTPMTRLFDLLVPPGRFL